MQERQLSFSLLFKKPVHNTVGHFSCLLTELFRITFVSVAELLSAQGGNVTPCTWETLLVPVNIQI